MVRDWKRIVPLALSGWLWSGMVCGPCPGEGAAGAVGASATKENLDLPFDAIGSGDDDEEEAPEIVVFYGTSLEGDGFFYVIDRSGSMMDSGELNIAKREVIKNITEFTDKVFFGIFLFDRTAVKFPSSGDAASATPAMKTSGVRFVQTAQSGHGSCPQTGLSAAIQMANRCSAKRKVIVYVGDGGGTCSGANEADYLKQTISAVSTQNFMRIRIDAIGVLDVGPIQEKFLKDLAASNGGTYTRINR